MSSNGSGYFFFFRNQNSSKTRKIPPKIEYKIVEEFLNSIGAVSPIRTNPAQYCGDAVLPFAVAI